MPAASGLVSRRPHFPNQERLKMHARTMLLVLGLTISAIVPQALGAQRTGAKRPIELGVDAALAYQSGDRVKVTTLSIPVTRFRAGFFLTDAVSFEPSIALHYTHATRENTATGNETTSSGTDYDFDFGLLFHFSTDRTQSQTFIRPFVGLRGFSGDSDFGSSSASQGVFGLALGVKKPLVSRLAGRFEVGFAHATDDDNLPSSNQVFLSFGLSFFTR
jgi:hypothetical protein